jgi:hypothetical protein
MDIGEPGGLSLSLVGVTVKSPKRRPPGSSIPIDPTRDVDLVSSLPSWAAGLSVGLYESESSRIDHASGIRTRSPDLDPRR